jgi:hypothetical protein
MAKFLSIVLFLALGLHSAHAQDTLTESEWTSAKPSAIVTVSPIKGSDQYFIEATISDEKSGKVMASPKMMVFAGKHATVSIENDDGFRVTLKVVVDAASQSALTTTELHQPTGERSHSSTMTIAVKPKN